MDIWNVPPTELSRIVETVSAEQWGGNVVLKAPPAMVAPRTLRLSWGITVRDSSGPGSRTSASVFSTRADGAPRRVSAACWHAHRDVMAAIFARYPDARIRSHAADYRGAEAFAAEHEATAWANVGSLIYPRAFAECCDC